ncbi:MAG: protein kinase [Acidobacteriota bacterium]|nr:protein kinase [Acidobacteriota bacterium]
MSGLVFLASFQPGLAQTQGTFYAAYEDGLDAERQGHWRMALDAFRRASVLRPAPAAGVFTYGNNRLVNYYPYAHMARCAAELGDWKAVAAHLKDSEARGEPAALRDPIAKRLKEADSKAPAPREPEIKPTGTAAEPPVAQPPQILPPSMPEQEPLQPLHLPAKAQPLPEIRVAAPLPPGSPRAMVPASAPVSRPDPSRAPEPLPPVPLPAWLWILSLFLLAGTAGGIQLRRRRGAGAKNPESFQIHPTRLGPYRIERLLGRGGFANTYLAQHEQTSERVALKVLQTHRWDDADMLARFRQEAKVGAMLKHPNIVPILDAFPGGTSPSEPPWIAMEYVEGMTLDAHMRGHGCLPIAECCSIGLDLAEALAHAHTFGVVHRDLKPANVMLQQGRARVMDLGIARVLDSATVTSTYAFLGTPGYAAPEAQKRSHVGPAADRYSLGIILFEMLTGTPPFEGETPFEVLDRHRAHPLPDIRALRKDAPSALVRLVERLAQKDPDLRPEDLEVIKILKELNSAG